MFLCFAAPLKSLQDHSERPCPRLLYYVRVRPVRRPEDAVCSYELFVVSGVVFYVVETLHDRFVT